MRRRHGSLKESVVLDGSRQRFPDRLTRSQISEQELTRGIRLALGQASKLSLLERVTKVESLSR